MTYQPPSPPNTPGQPPQHPPQPQYPSGPYGAPPPPPPQFMPPPPPKKSRTPLVVGVSIACVVMLGCVIAAVNSSDSTDKAKVDKPAAAAKQATGDAPAEKAADEPKKAEDKPAKDDTFNVPIGSTITITAPDGGEAEGTIRSVKTYTKACSEYAPEPDNGMFVVVDVLVEQTKGSGSVNPLNFTFVGADGTTADSISGAFSACNKPSLDSTNSLRAGQKRAGKVAFDTSSKKGAVEWSPGGLGSDAIGSWKVG